MVEYKGTEVTSHLKNTSILVIASEAGGCCPAERSNPIKNSFSTTNHKIASSGKALLAMTENVFETISTKE
jgi:hypothetical protein